jgi:hypothetical protein
MDDEESRNSNTNLERASDKSKESTCNDLDAAHRFPGDGVWKLEFMSR